MPERIHHLFRLLEVMKKRFTEADEALSPRITVSQYEVVC